MTDDTRLKHTYPYVTRVHFLTPLLSITENTPTVDQYSAQPTFTLADGFPASAPFTPAVFSEAPGQQHSSSSPAPVTAGTVLVDHLSQPA